MSTERDVYEIETSGAVESLNKVKAAHKGVKDEVDASFPTFKTLAHHWQEDITKSFATAQAQFELVKKAFEMFTEVLKEGISEYLDQEVALFRLDFALQKTGEHAAEFKERFEKQAKEIEKTTGIQEEHTYQLQTMILAMGVGADQVERFTKDASDLAIVMGVDSLTAARTLARAHAEGKEELRRYGITINDVTDEGNGFSDVLAAVEGRTKDISAALPEAIRETNELKAAWSDIKKELGDLALKGIGVGVPGSTLWWLMHAKAIVDEVRKEPEKPMPGAGEIDVSVGKIDMMEKENAAAIKLAQDLARRKAAIEQDARTEEHKVREDEEEREVEFNEKSFTTWKQTQDKIKEDAKESLKVKQEVAEIERDFIRRTMQEEMDAEDKKAAYIKQIQSELVNEIKEFGRESLQFLVGMAKETLTSNTSFNRQMKEMAIQRQIVGLNEQQALEKRLEVEKKLQSEEKASQAKKLAEFLANIAQQAAMRAADNAAAAIEDLANENYKAAALHGAAALAFGALAGAAGGAAYAISSSRGTTADEDAQLDNEKASAESRAQREAKQQGQIAASGSGTQVNQYIIGITGYTEEQQGAELDRLRGKFEDLKTGSGGGRG